jgi:hypothetical protein
VADAFFLASHHKVINLNDYRTTKTFHPSISGYAGFSADPGSRKIECFIYALSSRKNVLALQDANKGLNIW